MSLLLAASGVVAVSSNGHGCLSPVVRLQLSLAAVECLPGELLITRKMLEH